jgi:hypothetical protein
VRRRHSNGYFTAYLPAADTQKILLAGRTLTAHSGASVCLHIVF